VKPLDRIGKDFANHNMTGFKESDTS